MRIYLTILSLISLLSCSTAKVTGQKAGNTTVSVLDMNAMDRNRSRIQNKDPELAEAYKQLIKDADKALKFEPVSVMEKAGTPPSGDKHDYMSLAPYWWPDPAKKDGLPYIRKDGQTNPEVKEYKDKEYMPKLCALIETLAMAYFFSENRVYADHATDLIRVWFIHPATKMNPNLNYGQAIKGRNEGRGAGLIDSRHFVKLIDAIGILKSSRAWKAADQKAMQQWFAEYLHWMQTSPVGLDELDAPNNHGAWYDAQRLMMALFIDSTDLAKRVVANAANRLDHQVDENGFFPKEMERTISLHYTAFVMDAFFLIANMSKQIGFDFWNHITPSGRSLNNCFMVLKPYFTNEKAWTGTQIKPYSFDEGYYLLMEGEKHFACGDCSHEVKRLADDKAPRLRINLLY